MFHNHRSLNLLVFETRITYYLKDLHCLTSRILGFDIADKFPC